MTLIIDDFREGLDVIFRPAENASIKLSVGDALALYYKFSVIPIAIFVIAGHVFLEILASMFSQSPVSPITSFFGAHSLTILVATSVAFFWIFLPVALLVQAALYQFLGGTIMGKFKGGYSATFSSVVFAMLPNVLVAWLAFIPGFDLIILPLVSIYGIYVLVIALTKQHKTTNNTAFAVWLVCSVVLWMLSIVGSFILSMFSFFHTLSALGA